jgi:transglutaminase-like putative cysteine protease
VDGAEAPGGLAGLSADAYSAFEGQRYLRRVARDLTQGASTDRERIDRLLEWTYLQVRPASWAAPSRVLFGDAYRTVKRGFGYCDHSAHVFSTLARDVGLMAQVFFLRHADGESPHTVSRVLLDGEWVFVDALYGRVLEIDGRTMTLDALRADPKILDAAYADIGFELPITADDFLRGDPAFGGDVPWWRD